MNKLLNELVLVPITYTVEEYLLEYCVSDIFKKDGTFYYVSYDFVEIIDSVEELGEILYDNEPEELKYLKDEVNWEDVVDDILGEFKLKKYLL